MFALGALALFPAVAAAQAQITIGGTGSFGSNGSFDPGLLDDGVTIASARYTFTLDAGNSQLEIVVENTSPVVPGVPNPVLTDIFFNTPAAITGISIASQTGSGGAPPLWGLSFDSDLDSSPNPHTANGFGAFNVQMSTPMGSIVGAIANPAADTLAVPPFTAVVGPVTFVLDLTGNLNGLTEDDFTTLLSVNPPGSQNFPAAGKFQAGGDGGQYSGFISPGSGDCPITATSETVPGGCGTTTLSATPPVMGTTGTVTISNAAPAVCGIVLSSAGNPSPSTFRGCTLLVNLNTSFRLWTFVTDGNGEASLNVPIRSFAESPACCGATFIVQGATFAKNGGGTMQLLEITNGVQITLGS